MEQLIGGRYQIITTLGSGGFGQTYLAEDRHQFNLRCVVKKLQPLFPSPETWLIATELFQREAQTQYRLGYHPQIPKILAYFQEQQEFYLVQELIEGHNLSEELLPGKHWSDSEVIALLQDVLEPLVFVHQQQVLHRDIKPPNLIRRKQDGKIVLIDFGSVKELAATEVVNAQGETQIVTTIGTPGYMPSEQSKGKARFSSDVYAVGIIGIQALTGKMPQELPEDPETAEIIWREQITVSPELAEVLDKMVRYDFRDRYHSAQEALEAVQQLTLKKSPWQNPKSPEITALAHPKVVHLEASALSKTRVQEKTLLCEIAVEEQKRLPTQHQDIIKSLNLATKSGSPYSLLKEVLDWTGGHPFLTEQLCQIIVESKYLIPSGREANWVEKLVQEQVIQNGKTKVIGAYIKTIQEHLLHNTICLPQMLLQLYLQILQQGEISTNQSREKQELIRLGLIIERKDKLKIANRLYQSIFNRDWVQKQLSTLGKNSSTTPNQALKIKPSKQQIATATPIKNEPLTKIITALSIFGLLLMIPLAIFLDNSQTKFSVKNISFDSQSLSRSTLCIEPIPTKEATQKDWLTRLKQSQQRFPEQFPANCQRNLDQLIVVQALQLGHENHVLDGVAELCQISPTSESFNQAQMELSRLYTDGDWGEITQFYLRSLSDCPASQWNLTNYEFSTHYQQAKDYLEQSDYPQVFDSLYLAAEQAITAGQPTLLLAEILTEEQSLFKSVARQEANQWQLLKETLIQSEPLNYQLTYQRAKLLLDGDHNHHHTREFELLFAAAKIAIENQQSKSMLSQLQQDRLDRFKNLTRGHPEWLNLIEALKQNNLQFLVRK